MIKLQIHEEWWPAGHDFGCTIFKEGKKTNFYSGTIKQIAPLLERSIQAQSLDGGVIQCFPSNKEAYDIEVQGCPTGHAHVVDDYMGGTLCRDCKAMW